MESLILHQSSYRALGDGQRFARRNKRAVLRQRRREREREREREDRWTDKYSDAVASEMRRDRAISWIGRGHALSVSGAANVTRC